MSGTVTYPVELPNNVALKHQPGMPYDFVLSWSNSYRSLERADIPQQANILPVGSFLTATFEEATTPGDIRYILCQAVDPRPGPDRATVVARHAEVSDAYLAYGTLDRTAVNTHLREELGIIVREAVLPRAVNSTFAGQGGA